MRATAIEIVSRLQAAGFRAYWVGGCVRDSLLGREPGDYDIATDARAEEVERLFARTIPVGRQFGVVVVVEAGTNFQVATFRAESDYADGRRPSQVTFGNPRADALRRDFTVNGLFFDPITSTTHDWVDGEADLRARLIRTIGQPEERFTEDHLRLLRAVRFAAQLDFQIEPETFAAVRALAERIKVISAERIRDELLKLFLPGIAEPSHRQPGSGDGFNSLLRTRTPRSRTGARDSGPASIPKEANRDRGYDGALSHAVQGRPANAQIHPAAHDPTTHLSAGTGVASAGLPGLARATAPV